MLWFGLLSGVLIRVADFCGGSVFGGATLLWVSLFCDLDMVDGFICLRFVMLLLWFGHFQFTLPVDVVG